MTDEINAPWECQKHDDAAGYIVVDRHDNILADPPNQQTGKLIAAAPDLLEAAEAAVDCVTVDCRICAKAETVQHCESPDGFECLRRKWLKKMIAAVAEAKGE